MHRAQTLLLPLRPPVLAAVQQGAESFLPRVSEPWYQNPVPEPCTAHWACCAAGGGDVPAAPHRLCSSTRTRILFRPTVPAPVPQVAEMYLPRRTAFVYEMGGEWAPDVPTLLRRSKEDCPKAGAAPSPCLQSHPAPLGCALPACSPCPLPSAALSPARLALRLLWFWLAPASAPN